MRTGLICTLSCAVISWHFYSKRVTLREIWRPSSPQGLRLCGIYRPTSFDLDVRIKCGRFSRPVNPLAVPASATYRHSLPFSCNLFAEIISLPWLTFDTTQVFNCHFDPSMPLTIKYVWYELQRCWWIWALESETWLYYLLVEQVRRVSHFYVSQFPHMKMATATPTFQSIE